MNTKREEKLLVLILKADLIKGSSDEIICKLLQWKQRCLGRELLERIRTRSSTTDVKLVACNIHHWGWIIRRNHHVIHNEERFSYNIFEGKTQTIYNNNTIYNERRKKPPIQCEDTREENLIIVIRWIIPNNEKWKIIYNSPWKSRFWIDSSDEKVLSIYKNIWKREENTLIVPVSRIITCWRNE